jgi:hypothetical protein
MRGHPTAAARCQTMRGPRRPTPPGPRGRPPDIDPGGRSRTIRWCSSDAPRSGSSGRDSRPARCSTGGPRGRAQHRSLVPEQAAALRRRRERRTLAATLARSSVACVLWAGAVSMTPPGRVAAAPAPLAVAPLDRHSPARRYARTALGPACSSGLATFNSRHHAKLCALPPLRGPACHPEERRRADDSAGQTVVEPRKGPGLRRPHLKLGCVQTRQAKNGDGRFCWSWCCGGPART